MVNGNAPALGVFTSLLHKLGVQGLEVTEVFDIDELCAGTRGTPRGLIFCYPCAADEDLQGKNEDSQGDAFDDTTPDPDAKDIWFAHQLCNDACATQAILNITFNLRDVRLQAELDEFKRDTDKMSPVVRVDIRTRTMLAYMCTADEGTGIDELRFCS